MRRIFYRIFSQASNAESAQDTVKTEKSAIQRDDGIDGLRGFLIVCVVIGHTPLQYLAGNTPIIFGLSLYYVVVQTIWFFALPLFIAISCLYVQPLSLKYAGKRALALLLPYVVYLLIQQRDAAVNHHTWWLQMLAWGNFAKLNSIIWFLPALYSCNMAASAIVRFEKRSGFWPIMAALAILSIMSGPWMASVHNSIPFGIDVAVMMLPFIFGLRAIEQKRKQFEGSFSWIYLLIFIGSAGCMYAMEPPKLTNPWQNKIDLAQYSIPSTIFTYAVWFTISASLFLGLRALAPRWLSFLGSYTMPVYLLHYETFKIALTEKWPEKFGTGYTQAIAVVIIAIFIPLAIAITARHIFRPLKHIGL